MRNRLLCATAVGLCLTVTAAAAQQAITTPILESDENFRDLAGIAAIYGGTGFADTTSHNGVMRTGVFYRSEALSTLNSADQAILSSLRIGLDIDLRTPSEIAGPPDPPMAPNAGPDKPIGAAYLNVNIFGSYNPTQPATTSSQAAIASMMSTYQYFVTDPVQRAGFRAALLALANESEAALFHCSGGKDRTGWTAMLLQSIAGVSPATIMNDYLATNSYLATYINSAVQGLPPDSDQAKMLRALLGVQPGYLQAGLDQMIAQYGSLNAYLTEGLGLTQADIYVLRAKMVYYSSLPGQGGFVGNAAAGAALLSALQNSPLSGRYTAFNYYLQSAIDAGTLGSVETQVGAQVHADAASYLSRQPLWVDTVIAPYASGRDLAPGQSRVWLAGLGSYFHQDARAGAAGSSERSAGPVVGATWRIDPRMSAFAAIGNICGAVGSAGGNADVDTAAAMIGGRFGFSTLDAGPYVAARADFGWVDYHGKRTLGGGLGIAQGDTHGAVYGGRADLGDVIRLAPFTITPQIGVRVTQVDLGGFDESGSEVALAVERIKHASSTVVADLDASLDARRLNDWTIAPSLTLGYERALGNPQIESTGMLYGFTVSQFSAFDSRNLVRAGLALTAQRDAVTVRAGLNAVRGDDAATGINAQVSVSYRF